MAKDHKKPTKAELEEQAIAALQPSATPPPPSPSPSEPPPSKPNVSPSPTPPPPSPSPSEPPPSPDYKERYKESTREAQILHAKNKKLNESIEQAGDIPDPTEEELRNEFSEWDDMTETEKKLAKSAYVSIQRFAKLQEATKEFKDIDVWSGKVDTFIADPKTLMQYPELEGKTEEFISFASKPTRRGLDFADLVAAFLYDATRRKISMKGKMFETGTGGPAGKPKPKSDKISLEEAAVIQKTDYNEYKRLLKARKIDMTTV